MNTLTSAPPRPRTPAGHATVLGVHGAEGQTGWKAFYTRRELASPTEAVEWATLPPGAVSGEHRHTRTEEIYLILDGNGEFFLNGAPHPVRRGTLALTTPGNTHGLRNTGNTALNWWVIETLTPRTQNALNGTDHTETAPMPAQIFDLNTAPRFDTQGIFDGPLTAVERRTLTTGQVLTLGEETTEIAGFLNQGTAELAFPGSTAHIEAPTAFLVPAGATATFTPETGVELFTVELRITRP
ncbi:MULTISPECIES: cupin domain-containing protein [Arthrobacter]|uniref:Cupin domain-containing protein n=1 Tax=Arthrobacter terricola TaxID=2547396 RepID=A0A4V2ZRT9_9MICC|nr:MULTISPECIES: cupin domain-containing protein [Arthrobacter]MBT8163741.1 cupin domain-containing protein [Arthrobacter sp. GN70]TDF87196.1 cupin domain-containing protein [Arthrobacter terricola]